MNGTNYKQVVIWNPAIIDVSFIGSEQSVPLALRGLANEATQITTGAPAATANQWIPGAVVHNAVDGTMYINAGSTAVPSWEIVDVSSGTLPTLPDGEVWAGNSSNVAAAGYQFGKTDKTSLNKILGSTKFDDRPTGGSLHDYNIQLRANVGKTSGTYFGLDLETHLTKSGTASIRGAQGVAVLDSTYTSSGGMLVGSYGQARADGTFNAPAGILTGVYGLIEASAAITADHVASGWFDTHQVNPITGSYEILYLTNNGSLILNQIIYQYGSSERFASINSGGAMVTGGTAADGTPKKLRIDIDGTAYYVNLYPTNHP